MHVRVVRDDVQDRDARVPRDRVREVAADPLRALAGQRAHDHLVVAHRVPHLGQRLERRRVAHDALAALDAGLEFRHEEVQVAAQGLDDWANFGTRFLGMQQVDRTQKRMALRMDDRKQRVIIHSGEDEGPSFYGWEVAGAAALDALAAHLERHGVKVARGSRALADERRVKDLIVFSDPIGNRLEAFYGAEVASDAFKLAIPADAKQLMPGQVPELSEIPAHFAAKGAK